jgi:hypothetical protein
MAAKGASLRLLGGGYAVRDVREGLLLQRARAHALAGAEGPRVRLGA